MEQKLTPQQSSVFNFELPVPVYGPNLTQRREVVERVAADDDQVSPVPGLNRPDLIVFEIKDDDPGGLNLLRWLRLQHSLREVLLVACS